MPNLFALKTRHTHMLQHYSRTCARLPRAILFFSSLGVPTPSIDYYTNGFKTIQPALPNGILLSTLNCGNWLLHVALCREGTKPWPFIPFQKAKLPLTRPQY